MSENLESSMIAAMERSSATFADTSSDLGSVMPKVCAELSEFAWSNVVCRTLFRCAVLEGTAHRARFVSLLLSAEGQLKVAWFLAEHAISSGAKPWQKRRLSELMDTPPAIDSATPARGRFCLNITDDGQVHVGKNDDGGVGASGDLGVPSEQSGDVSASADGWLTTLIALLDKEPVGIHSDVLTINVADGALAFSTLRSVLASIQLLPVVTVLLADSPASVPHILESISSARFDCLSPVVSAPTRSGRYGLITAGGGELLDAGPAEDLVLATSEDLISVASALGLLDLYDSPVLHTHQALLVEAFRSESSGLFPLWNSTRSFSRAVRFRGTPRATSPLRRSLTGHLLASGFLNEARTLLEAVPPRERDRVHDARKLRADFGTAHFQEATASADGRKRSPADESLVNESAAAMALLSELDVGPRYPKVTFDAIEGKVLSILHASVPDQSGGYAVRAHSVLRTIRRNGFEVVAVTRPGFPEVSNTLEPGTSESFELDDIRYLRIGTRLPRQTGEYAYMRESVAHYCEVIRQERPSVIHLRSTYVSALPGLIAAKRFGLPVLYEVSGMWELVYEASNTARMESRRARTICLEDAVLSHADGVLTLTEAMRDIIESRVSTRRAVEIVPNAVDANVFSHHEKNPEVLSRFGWDPLIPTIGYIGTFVHYEGLDVLIRALARLQDNGLRFQALLVGDGAEASRLRRLAADLGLDETALQFTGRVPHAEVADLYSVIDVCAYPRRLTPATRAVSPLKPFEAMASKKAVIVSNVPALAEIGGHGQRALVVPSDDVDALTEALDLVIRDPKHTEHMVAAAAEWTRRERSWDAVGRVMTEMLTSLSEDGKGNAPGDQAPHDNVAVSDTVMETLTT